MAHGFQRKGRAQGAGFYDYDDDEEEEPDLWSGLSAFVRKSLKMPADDVRDRLQAEVVSGLNEGDVLVTGVRPAEDSEKVRW